MNWLDSSSESGSSSASFELLHEKVRRWIYTQEWTELRDAQEKAIPLILACDRDICISAATASGKTEAAFLPICSKALVAPLKGMFALYVAPLKALINDQFDRLDRFCSDLDLRVTKWHGDVPNKMKSTFLKDPKGILLITPESLEAFFITKSHEMKRVFSGLTYVIIDELHSFIGTERGRQVQSLIHRIESLKQKRVPRIGLSATLGEMNLALDFLRPGKIYPSTLIQSDLGGQEIRIQVRGYRLSQPKKAVEQSTDDYSNDIPSESEDTAYPPIVKHLYDTLRGSKNLIFANSRTNTEKYADAFRRICEETGKDIDFYPHHGSLSKDIRENTESMMKDQERVSATAVCTSTLELGIDIGTVRSIAQIGSPPSVASLRQRLGRSGRRGEPAILRCYIEEQEIHKNSSIQDKLRSELFQISAMIQLLLTQWCEPPDRNRHHFSTLIQQLLSATAQHGGIHALNAWKLLCQTGPFVLTNQTLFAELLRCLGQKGLLRQASDAGDVILDWKGEKIVNHYDFYVSFLTPDEYSLYGNKKYLGTMPISFSLTVEQYLIFAGRRWRIVDIDESKKVIQMISAKGGKVPKFAGGGFLISDEVRKEMLTLYDKKEVPVYLDSGAADLYQEGQKYFEMNSLSSVRMYTEGRSIYLFPWIGDRTMHTLGICLRNEGLDAEVQGMVIVVERAEEGSVRDALGKIQLYTEESIDAYISTIQNKTMEKYDWVLSQKLLDMEYRIRMIDLEGCKRVARELTAD